MVAVEAMATAPQNTTRRVGFHMLAPPARAPIAPRTPSPMRQAMETVQVAVQAGDRRATASGKVAPDAKVTAEVKAA